MERNRNSMRSTSLKSDIFADNLPEDLPVDEYDITKIGFNSCIMPYETLQNEVRLLESTKSDKSPTVKYEYPRKQSKVQSFSTQKNADRIEHRRTSTRLKSVIMSKNLSEDGEHKNIELGSPKSEVNSPERTKISIIEKTVSNNDLSPRKGYNNPKNQCTNIIQKNEKKTESFLRRSTRLKSDICVDSFSKDLSDSVNNKTREELDSFELELGSPKKKAVANNVSENPTENKDPIKQFGQKKISHMFKNIEQVEVQKSLLTLSSEKVTGENHNKISYTTEEKRTQEKKTKQSKTSNVPKNPSCTQKPSENEEKVNPLKRKRQSLQKTNPTNINNKDCKKSKISIPPKKRGRKPKSLSISKAKLQRYEKNKKYEKQNSIQTSENSQAKQTREHLKEERNKNKFTSLKKLTKSQIKKMGERKIPQNRLEDALDMIDNDNNSVWENRNISCNRSIYLHWEQRGNLTSDENLKLKYARQFLLRRDWTSLTKVLLAFNLDSKKTYFPLVSKYATILMAHTNKQKLSEILQFLTRMDDSSIVMKKCTTISKAHDQDNKRIQENNS